MKVVSAKLGSGNDHRLNGLASEINYRQVRNAALSKSTKSLSEALSW
jgi:hypothetical protein